MRVLIYIIGVFIIIHTKAQTQTIFGINLDNLPTEHYAIVEQIKENSKDYYVLTKNTIFPKLLTLRSLKVCFCGKKYSS